MLTVERWAKQGRGKAGRRKVKSDAEKWRGSCLSLISSYGGYRGGGCGVR